MNTPSPSSNLLVRIICSLARFVCLVALSSLGGAVLCLFLGTLVPALGTEFVRFSLVWFVFGAPVLAIALGAILRGPGWLFQKTSTPFYGWATVLVFSFVVLYYSVEKWRGKRMWAKAQSEMVARGETLGARSLALPPVPEDQNLVAAPIIAEAPEREKGHSHPAIFQLPDADPFHPLWMDDIPWLRQQPLNLKNAARTLRISANSKMSKSERLAADERIESGTPAEQIVLYYLGAHAADIEKLRVASYRPYARVPLPNDGILATFDPPVRKIVRRANELLAFRAAAELKTGEAAQALEDTRCALRLARLDYQIPTPGMFHGYVTLTALQPVWEGLLSQRWSATELATLQGEIATIHPVAEFAPAAKLHCWAYIELMNQIFPTSSVKGSSPYDSDDQARHALEAIRLVYPNGWSYQNQAGIYWDYRQSLKAVDTTSGRVYSEVVPRKVFFHSVDPIYACLILPLHNEIAYEGLVYTALTQTGIDLAVVACALERCRIATGEYPPSLEALVPAYLEKVPHDVVSGQPLHYEKTVQTYRLYSTGWNQAGKKADRNRERFDSHASDWTWR